MTRRLDGLLQGDYRGPGPRPRHRGRRDAALRGRRRRAPHRLERHGPHAVEPHIRQTIADRELETWVLADFSASLAFGTADCEKRDLALAAAGRHRLPDPAHRQPHRRGRARGRPPRHPAGPHRPRPTSRPCCTGRCQAAKDDHPGASDLDGALRRLASRHPPPRDDRGRLRLPRRTTTWDRPLRAAERPPRGPGRRDRRPAASSSCPTSACSTWSTPRPAPASRDQHRQRPHPGPIRRGRRRPARRDRPAHPRPPAPTTWCCAPTATGCSTWCASSPCVASASRHVKRLAP